MAIDIQRTLDFGGARKIINLPDPTGDQDAATKRYVDGAVEGLAWKDSVRVATQSNINLASPGATIDGRTMVAGDRVLVMAQTVDTENGIYIWNGASVTMTRSIDANTDGELDQAIITVEGGTSAGVTYRQTAINTVIGATSIAFTQFGTSSGPATESSAGLIEIATQTEVNAGTDTARAVTPATLSASNWASKKFVQNIGDGSATSYTVTHNLNTRDIDVEIYRNSGNYDTVLAEIQRTTVNSITVIFDSAPSANAFRVKIST